jgi:ribosomal protein S18 acetylase RimI-like enzyme
MTLKTFLGLWQEELSEYYGEDFLCTRGPEGERIQQDFNDHVSDSAIICLVDEGPMRYTKGRKSPRRGGKKRRDKMKHRYSYVNPFNRIHGYAIVQSGDTNLVPDEKRLLSIQLICSSPFSDKKGVGSDLMDILKKQGQHAGYTDIILEVANEFSASSDYYNGGDEEDEDDGSDEEDGWPYQNCQEREWEWFPSDEIRDIIAHELWRKTGRKDIDGDSYYNVEKDYISEELWHYFYILGCDARTWTKTPKKISDEDDPGDSEYGGFWYKRGLESSDGLIRFYRKHGFEEDRRVHLDWQCYGDIPFPTMLLTL